MLDLIILSFLTCLLRPLLQSQRIEVTLPYRWKVLFSLQTIKQRTRLILLSCQDLIRHFQHLLINPIQQFLCLLLFLRHDHHRFSFLFQQGHKQAVDLRRTKPGCNQVRTDHSIIFHCLSLHFFRSESEADHIGHSIIEAILHSIPHNFFPHITKGYGLGLGPLG